ncbi:hypothetical protein Pcinc_006365 [Petrolisthes cinctipes]|uniref:Vitellogenin domain-containing protein n=1 Tax=Petrolisthes cinctipes TaxID=88211 RepID=A0AAE1GBP4_PETCI|nr:hypothetical protein Pcinc_006365 [Petrolisthes cinctipes]
MQRVEVEVEGSKVYTGGGLVEVSRFNRDTLLLLTSPHLTSQHQPTSSLVGDVTGVVVRTVGGGVPSLLHPPSVSVGVLNHMRSLASLLTPATPPHTLTYHTQTDVLGRCEVRYERMVDEAKTVTWRDLPSCSHFTLERSLGGRQFPFLHLTTNLDGSSSTCEYHWSEAGSEVLEGAVCRETLIMGPRYQSSNLNITLVTTLQLTHTAPLHPPSILHYLQESTETTDLKYQPEPSQATEDSMEKIAELLEALCSTEEEEENEEEEEEEEGEEGEGEEGRPVTVGVVGMKRVTGDLTRQLTHLTQALAHITSDTPLPQLPSACPSHVRSLLTRELHHRVNQQPNS